MSSDYAACGIIAGVVRGCVTSPEENWSRFSFCSGMVPTTERYLGCKQKLRNAVNDGIDLAES